MKVPVIMARKIAYSNSYACMLYCFILINEKAAYYAHIISLQQFDCLLFIENVLAIANNIAQKNYS